MSQPSFGQIQERSHVCGIQHTISTRVELIISLNGSSFVSRPFFRLLSYEYMICVIMKEIKIVYINKLRRCTDQSKSSYYIIRIN